MKLFTISLILFGLIILTQSCYSKKVVGEWKLYEYKDDLKRSSVDSIEFAKNLESFKENIKLIFKRNKEFLRYGFSYEPEKGNWKINKRQKCIHFSRFGSLKDTVKYEQLTKESLTLISFEPIDDKLITTKLLFKKIND